jgi:putative mRNA 3-end processing factor
LSDLVTVRPEGLYCERGDFYIDPWRPVERAVLTHAHGDHAHAGHRRYLAAAPGAEIVRQRLGDIALDTLAYGEQRDCNGVRIALFPAGHILGSAQVRIEHRGEVWVVSGDYKVQPDATCSAFEPVRCDVFITESTFGLPIYRWPPAAEVFASIQQWWSANAAAGRPSVLFCYALGKAQRILNALDPSTGAIVCQGAIEPINALYARQGIALAQATPLATLDRNALRQALILAPPSARRSPWMKRFAGHSDAFQRLDATTRSASPARCRPRLRVVRSRRLAGSARCDCRQRRASRVGDARQRAQSGAMAARTRFGGSRARHGIWRRRVGGGGGKCAAG